MEYTSSGPEKPLAYFFITIILLLTLRIANTRDPGRSETFALLLGLIAAGFLLTRIDLILVILPAGLVVLWRLRNRMQLFALLAVSAVLPIVAWITWSRITCSAWLPNHSMPRQMSIFLARIYNSKGSSTYGSHLRMILLHSSGSLWDWFAGKPKEARWYWRGPLELFFSSLHSLYRRRLHGGSLPFSTPISFSPHHLQHIAPKNHYGSGSYWIYRACPLLSHC